MDQREKETLQVRLQEKGFHALLVDQIDDDLPTTNALIPLKHRVLFGEDVVNYDVYIQFNHRTYEYEISHFDASLRKPLEIPQAIVHGINVIQLDERMAALDWWTDQPDQRPDKRDVYKDLWALSQNGHPIGIEAQDKLILKYLADTPAVADVSHFAKRRARHEVQRTFRGDASIQFTAIQAYNLMSGRPVAVMMEQDGETVQRWVQCNDLVKDFTGMPVLEVTAGNGQATLKELLENTIYAESMTAGEIYFATQSLAEGNPTIVRSVLDGEEKSIVLVADDWGEKVKVDYATMRKLGLVQAFDEQFQIAHQSPENEKVIEAALRNLTRWGFDDIDVGQVRAAVYFDEPGLLLTQKMAFGHDSVDYKIRVEWREGMGEYFPSGYEATLRKEIVLPATVHRGIPVADLERRFSEIDWSAKNYIDPAERRIRLLDKVEGPVQLKVDQLVADLAEYARHEFRFRDGLALEDKLRFKYWEGTPNDAYIPNRKALQQALTTSVDIDLFSFMGVTAPDVYKLLHGHVLHTPIYPGVDLGVPSFGYIVLKDISQRDFIDEPSRRHVIQWVDGPSEFDLRRELNKLIAQGAASNPTREILPLLLQGERVPITRSGEPEPTHYLLLGLMGKKVDLIRQTVSAAVTAESLAFGQDDLLRHWHKMGFDGYESTIFRHLQHGSPRFTIEDNWDWGDNVHFKAELGLSPDAQTYEIKAVQASLLLPIVVPDITLKQLAISTGELEQAMHRIDWGQADYYQRGHDPHDRTPAGEMTTAIEAYEIFEDLEGLYRSMDWKAKWTAEALSVKYFLNTPNEGFLKNREPVGSPYEISHTFEGSALLDLTMERMYNLMQGRSVWASLGPGGQAEWHKLNFSGLAENKPAVLEKIPVHRFWEPLAELYVSRIHEQYPDPAIERLQNGELVPLSMRFEGNQYVVPVYADPAHNRLVFRFDAESPIGSYLSQQPGWVHEKIEWPTIGQLRDIKVHPVPVNLNLVQELKDDLAELGFVKNYDEQLTKALRIGYPEFTIQHLEVYDDKNITAHLHFEADNFSTGAFLDSYDLSYGQKGHPEIKLSLGSGQIPMFQYSEAVNIAAGRPVYISPKDISRDASQDYWYILDRESVSENGSFGVKTEIFPVAAVAALLEKMPVKEPANDAQRMQLIQLVRTGNLAPVTYQSGGAAMPGYLYLDLERQKVRFLPEWEVNPQPVSRSRKRNEDPGEEQPRQSNGRKP